MFSVPKKRSKLRRHIGLLYYTLRKRWYWYKNRATFGSRRPIQYSAKIFSAHSPILRKLDGVEEEIQKNKATNLALAIQEIDGIVLEPGQRFSFWREVGMPTKKRGFLPGLILTEGRIGTGTGGGLCQMTNLLYWITLHTSLTVIERWRHSYDVFPDAGRTRPFASGATCSYPLIDLQIENQTNQPYQLHVWIEYDRLHAQWLAQNNEDVHYEIYEKNHTMTQLSSGPYVRSNELHRKTLDTMNNVLKDELVVQNQALMMYTPFLK